MTYDQLYSPDDFRLTSAVWFGNRAFGGGRAAGRYESVQLCSGGWVQHIRPQGAYLIGFGHEDTQVRRSFHATFLTARFAYAELVLRLAHQRTLERFPGWLDHDWTAVELGWRKIEFTSPYRADAEDWCRHLVREIAESGEVSINEEFRLDFCDYLGKPVASEEEARTLNGDYRRVWLVADVPEMDEQTEKSYRTVVARGESFMPSSASLRFGYEEIAPFFAYLNPWLLSLVNAEDGRPPRSALDLDLFDAVNRLDIERALRLVEQGANINALDDLGETSLTALATASKFQEWPKDKEEAERRAQLDITQDERIQLMRRLIEHGADINLFGYEGVSPLTQAVLATEDKVVEFLLAEGADPNRNHFPDEEPEEVSSALDYAATDFSLAERGSPEEARLKRIYEALKKAGAVFRREDNSKTDSASD